MLRPDTHTVTIKWGDGSSDTTLNLAAGQFSFSTTHQYKDDVPTSSASDVNAVQVTVKDSATPQASASAQSAVTVRNLSPVITTASGAGSPQALGTVTTVTAAFTDVGAPDTHTCSVNWDDGSTPPGVVSESAGNGSCTANHLFTSAGVYSVVVTITDDDTGSANKAIDLRYVVIFDPSGGFVTGGGGIVSPAGACRLTAACLASVGHANFGFVSKYKKGSNVPEGQTEFQFQAGDLNFHSSAYDAGSLVVAGYKAQYKGTGEINGVPGYRFVLTAYDGSEQGGGGVDKFRMKITTAALIYDNRTTTVRTTSIWPPDGHQQRRIVIHKWGVESGDLAIRAISDLLVPVHGAGYAERKFRSSAGAGRHRGSR